MYVRTIVSIALCLLIGISASSLNAKETTNLIGSLPTLNQTLENNHKEVGRLRKELTNTLDGLRKTKSPDESQLQYIETLEKSNRWLSQVDSSIDATRNYTNILTSAERLTTEAETNLKQPIEYANRDKIRKLSIDELNNSNNQVILDLENERTRRNDLEMQLTGLNDRREKINPDIAQFNKRLQTLKLPKTAQSNPETKDKSSAPNSNLVNTIESLFLNQKLIELQWEQRSFEVRRDILRNDRQIAERNVLKFEKNAAVVQEVLNIARIKVATESIESAEDSRKKLANTHPGLKSILITNQSLANESAEISTKISVLSTDKQTLEQQLETYRQSFSSIKDKVSSAGLSDTIGIRLRSAKNQLPDISTFTKRLEKRRNEIEHVQLRRIELEDRSLELIDLPQEINSTLSTITFADDTERKQIELALTKILKEQRDQYLPNVLKTYDSYVEKTLIPLIEKEKQFVSLIDEYAIFINERILWVKSSQALTYKDLIQSLKSLTWLVNPFSWITVANDLISIAKHNLFLTTFISLLFFAAFFTKSFLVEKLKYYGRYKTKLSLAKFSDSINSGFITLLLAIYWPFLLWLIALGIIKNAQNIDVFTQAVAQGLMAMANVMFVVLLFMQMLRNAGLIESHFRWKIDNVRRIKHQLYWFAPLVTPFVFVVQMTNSQPIQAHFDSLGRLAFICITLMLTGLIFNLIAPKKGLFKDELSQNPDGWLNRTRFIWLPLALTAPLALAVTAVSGYLYTATELMLLLINSFWVVIVAVIARAFLIRWFNIEQRKLAMEQVRKKIVSQAESASAALAASTGSSENTRSKENTGSVATPSQSTEAAQSANTEEMEINLSQISHQTLSLLNNAIGFSVIVGLYLVWADILPALNVLDNISLWESTSALAGGQVTTTSITLGDGLAALVILLVTTLIGINIPGLLEIAILQRLPFTPSARYGITTIVRYIIVIIGILFTFNAIGIGWAKVQWLAAAVTVGLGFGLQEIFANFVSGIIILIERQIRVGDAVTIGSISGKVSRIKMRATTIIDWDRKELIIPNKEFVTGQVVNWTLSDTIIRLVIPVGIAYGSDTEKAHEILLKLARENKYILTEPKPEAFFSDFGQSSLDFELRVFLPNAELRVPMRHELLMQIDQAFRKANIEIAFPQRDIHIRSLPENVEFTKK